MFQRYRFLSVLACVLCIAATTLACVWDYDTLKQERGRFPSTLELITGKFLRHSPEFYAWRIQDRLAKLASDPDNLAYHDDLAVAYEKTGQHDKAIETMLVKEKLKPGLYETYSNLGTFHILAGDFEKGLPYIDKALAINPDAHFGRERYQKWLVEYALWRCKDGKLTFPLRLGTLRASSGFAEFLRQRLEIEDLSKADLQRAVKGILGMMRFANHDNPLLLEALGDILQERGNRHWMHEIDAKRLAARAYLKASCQVKNQAASDAYRKLAEEVLWDQTANQKSHIQLELAELEAEFKAEVADADKWYAKLKKKELGWIRNGKDADAEFDRLYAAEPQALGEIGDDFDDKKKEDIAIVAEPATLESKVLIVLGFLSVLLLAAMVLRWISAT